MNDDQPKTAYMFKITLLESKPAIWRRFCVPGEITLDRLHDVVQIIMGWEESHLHCFEIDGRKFSESDEDMDAEWLEEAGFILRDLVPRAGIKFIYEYDFGDAWRHELLVERIDEVPEGHQACIVCIDGKRACPPEDVGGIDGYVEFLVALKKPNHPLRLDWLENGPIIRSTQEPSTSMRSTLSSPSTADGRVHGQCNRSYSPDMAENIHSPATFSFRPAPVRPLLLVENAPSLATTRVAQFLATIKSVIKQLPRTPAAVIVTYRNPVLSIRPRVMIKGNARGACFKADLARNNKQ